MKVLSSFPSRETETQRVFKGLLETFKLIVLMYYGRWANNINFLKAEAV